MHHVIKSIYVVEEYKIVVQFVEGITKIWDLDPWFTRYPKFLKFKTNPCLFYDVRVDVGGCGIIWDDELDMDCNAIFDEGEVVITPFDGLISLSDACKLWNLNESTLRKAISYNKLKPGIDVIKFGNQWVVTRESMLREYGEARN